VQPQGYHLRSEKLNRKMPEESAREENDRAANLNENSERQASPSLLQITWSVFAAFCGVQNQANHDTDNAHIEQVGFMPYIIIGIAMTIMFVVLIYAIVQVVLKLAV
jgi:hypothetical protein